MGAVPPPHVTLAGQLTVWDPPLVKIKVKDETPVEGTLEKVNVVEYIPLVPTVALTTLAKVKSISVVHYRLYPNHLMLQ